MMMMFSLTLEMETQNSGKSLTLEMETQNGGFERKAGQSLKQWY